MKTFVSYAQNFEDVLLWRALQDVQGGFYIDVGANSPVEDSVSLSFYEHGWRGLNVEPSLAFLAELREQRPRDINLHAALAAEAGLLKFHDIADTGLSTLREDVARQHAEVGFTVTENWVTVVTLDDVLASVPQAEVHWMKIDVEGAEADVLAGWNSSPVRPWVVVVEGVDPTTHAPSHAVWEPALLAKGYAFAYFDGLNRYYVSDAQPHLAKAFTVGPNVFDRFALSGTATSTFTSLLTFKLEEADVRLQEASQAFRVEQTQWLAREADERSRHEAARNTWHNRETELSAIVSTLQDERRSLNDALLANERQHVQEKNAIHLRLIEALSQQRGLTQERDAAQQEVQQQQAQVARFSAEVESLHLAHSSLLEELRVADSRLQEREGVIRQLQGNNQEILNSASWRVTAPLRMLTSLMRGSRRGASQYFNETIRYAAQLPIARRLAQTIITPGSRLHRSLVARVLAAPSSMQALPAPMIVGAETSLTGTARGHLLDRMNFRLCNARYNQERQL